MFAQRYRNFTNFSSTLIPGRVPNKKRKSAESLKSVSPYQTSGSFDPIRVLRIEIAKAARGSNQDSGIVCLRLFSYPKAAILLEMNMQ